MKKLLLRLIRVSNSFFLVVVLIQVLLISLTLIFSNFTIRLLERTEKEKVESIVGYVENRIETAPTRAVIAVKGVVHNGRIAAAFASRDRDKLKEAASDTWNELKEVGFKQFQFHVASDDTTDLVTFLRMHDPARYNDSLLTSRPMVAKAFYSKTLLSGLEQGHSGYSFRAISPVFLDGKMTGTFEFGFDFGEGYLNVFNHAHPGAWGIYNLDRGVKALDDRHLVTAIGTNHEKLLKNLPLPEKILAVLKNGESASERDRESETVSIYVPVKNFRGDIALVVKYVYPTDYFARIREILWNSLWVCLIGLVLSTLIIYFLYRMITNPIGRLVAETNKIKNFDLDGEVVIETPLTEMKELVEATQSMKVGLQSFRKYVPSQLVRQLIQTKQEAVISGHRKNLTVLFTDVADFTTISENLTPNELAAQLSEYFSEMTAVIMRHEGTVDKYIGDAIMAFWGAPLDIKDHARKACLAALECQSKGRELARKWEAEGKPVFRTRIGLNTGEIIVGNMGSNQRLNYTVIGDAVNLASRLEGLNKTYGTRIIVSEGTAEQLPDDFALRSLDRVVVRGRSEPIRIYELVAEKGDITSGDLELVKAYHLGLDAYLARDWSLALERFEELLAKKPDDRSTRLMIERCKDYAQNPPPAKWRGEHVHHTK